VLDMAPAQNRSPSHSLHWLSSAQIARQLFGAEPTEAQRRSLRRAIRSLAAKDLIVTELINGATDRGYATMHYVARRR